MKVPDIQPVYQIENISDQRVLSIIRQIFDEDAVEIYETLPKNFCKVNIT